MSYPDTIAGRVLAVLDHDGIPERRRAAHLRDTCGISMYTAKRLINDIGRIRTESLINLSAGLDVSCAWLLAGAIERFHPRTMRIRVQNSWVIRPKKPGKSCAFLLATMPGMARRKIFFP